MMVSTVSADAMESAKTNDTTRELHRMTILRVLIPGFIEVLLT
jgi:hypothetical protein